MITPRFIITQTENEIKIVIHAPYTDLNTTEVHVDGDQLCFHSSPYYLRLHLPASVVEDENSKGSFDADKGDFTIILSKLNPGEKFEGLEMINALLNPPKLYKIANIEEMAGDSSLMPSEQIEDFDWFIEQKVEELPDTLISLPKYGFGNTKSGVFSKLESELPDLLDLQSPDCTPASEREHLQHTAENKSFSAEHYLADWAEEAQLISLLLTFKLPWESQEEEGLTSEEQEQLLRLPKRGLLPLDETEQRSALLALAELIFCWAHEQRSSSGDPGPESARSVRRLSATFSWLRQFQTVKQLTVSCVRRALCVPLYRNWNLAMKTLQDTQQILKKGRIRILKVLLDLLSMFGQCESHHVLSQLYLEPYCLWLQQCVSEHSLTSLALAIEKATPSKSDIEWDLEELEVAGRLTIEEETSKELADHVHSKLHIKELEGLDSDDCTSSEETESSSGDYSCSSVVSDTEPPDTDLMNSVKSA